MKRRRANLMLFSSLKFHLFVATIPLNGRPLSRKDALSARINRAALLLETLRFRVENKAQFGQSHLALSLLQCALALLFLALI